MMDGIWPGDMDEYLALLEAQRKNQEEKEKKEREEQEKRRRERFSPLFKYIERELMPQIEDHPFRKWRSSGLPLRMLTLEELITAWGEEGCDFLYNDVWPFVSSERKPGNEDQLVHIFTEQHSAYIAGFIALHLPRIMKTNWQDMVKYGLATLFEPEPVFEKVGDLAEIIMKEAKEYLQPEEEIKLIHQMYGVEHHPASLPQKFAVAWDNLARIPVKILHRDNVTMLPTENYELYHHLIPLCTSFDDFNRSILRASGEEEQYYRQLFHLPIQKELEKLPEWYYDLIKHFHDTATHDHSQHLNNNAHEFLFHALKDRQLLEQACNLYKSIKSKPTWGFGAIKVFPFSFSADPRKNTEQVRRYQKLFEAAGQSRERKLSVTGGASTILVRHRDQKMGGLFTSAFLKAYAIMDLFQRLYDVNKYSYEAEARKKLNDIIFEHWNKSKGKNYPYQIDGSITDLIPSLNLEMVLNSAGDHILQAGERTKALYKEIRELQKSHQVPLNPQQKYHQALTTIEQVLEELKHQAEAQKKGEEAEEFSQSIDRILFGLRFYNFDLFRVVTNRFPLFDLVNNVNECTAVGQRFEEQGFKQARDKHIGMIAGNIYWHEVYVDTIGKAVVVECHDESNKKVLLVDGVFMQQDIADLLPCESGKRQWPLLFTQAILHTAQLRDCQDIVINAYHTTSQLSSWQFLHSFADFYGLKEGRDYSYRENRRKQQITAEEGFLLTPECARQNVHYLEKIRDDSGVLPILLMSFAPNFWDPQHYPTDKKYSSVYDVPQLQRRSHQEQPYINIGKGYVVGLRISTEEALRRFKENYPTKFIHHHFGEGKE